MDDLEKELIIEWLTELHSLDMPKSITEIIEYHAKANATAEHTIRLLLGVRE